MASTSGFTSNYHIRSISLPCRLHPTAIRVEEELNKLKTLEASSGQTSEAICNALSGLTELYGCTNDLFSLQPTEQAKQINDLSDGSVRLLDICGSTRDLISEIKEHIRELQSAIRRRKGDLSIESGIAKFKSFRRQMRKEAKRSIASLKQIKTQLEASLLINLDQRHTSVTGLLRKVSLASISVFQSLLIFLSVPVSKPKGTRWSLTTKLIQTERVSCEEKMNNVNELESIDAVLGLLCRSSEGEKLENAQKRLVALAAHIDGMECSLDCLFRGLIRTRASFLNMVSQ